MPKSVSTEFEEAFETAKQEASMCVVGRLIADHEAGKVIEAKVGDTLHYSAATISRVLKNLGIVVSSNAVNLHRNDDCRCLPAGSA